MNRLQLLDAARYRSAGFSGSSIARIMHVSRPLLRYAFRSFRNYTEISDIELDQLLHSMLEQNYAIGGGLIMARLRHLRVFVARRRVRDAIRRIDPNGSAFRRHRVLRRRQYYVPHFNFIWHIDGYHKLIRWKIVVHGALDGFSRLCPYMIAATDNTAITAFSGFLQGVEHFGAPKFIRVDAGGENVMCIRYISYIRGAHNALIGRSVHNQRIERFWRDVYRGVACVFYEAFRLMEDFRLLNTDNEVTLRQLHAFVLPILNAALNEFREVWNTHGLRTESFRSPLQLMEYSRQHFNEKEGISDIEEQKLAASWLLCADKLQERRQARAPSAPRFSKNQLVSAFRTYLQE